MTDKEVMKTIEEMGGVEIESYSLISNYGYTFKKDGEMYDARFWANCYGSSPMVWDVMGGNREFARALTSKLNS